MCLFFKTKTAYECLISDWSSDVCSSDLDEAFADPNEPEQQPREIAACAAPQCISGEREQRVHPNPRERDDPARQAGESVAIGIEGTDLGHPAALQRAGGGVRSEEHTSELQSLMRISYAVFCLKKKKQKIAHTRTNMIN